jgi:O-antigen/teichoic acid export membrane protein
VSLIIFGRASQFILLLLTMRLATTYLPPSEIGRLSLITAATAFFALFLVNPVGMFINRRFHAWEELGRTRFYLKLHWLYLLAISLLIAVALIILNNVHEFDFRVSTGWLLVLVCGSVFFNTINQTAIPLLNLLELRGSFILLTLATIAAGLGIALLLVKGFSPTAEFWLLGLLIGQIIFAILGAQIFFGKLEPQVLGAQLPGHGHYRVLFNFAWPVAISVGFNWLQTQGYRFFVADSLGLTALGLFVAGYGISAGLMAAFESVLTTYFQPRFYQALSSNDQAEQSSAWSKYAGAILPSLILVIFMMVGLSPELTRFMVGPAYQSASQYVVWGVLAEGARVAAGVFSMSAHALMRTNLLLLPNMIGAAVCATLTWILSHHYGIHGVGLALVLSGLAMLVAMYYQIIRTLEMRAPYRPLLKSIVMGVSLLLIAMLGRWLLGGAQSLLAAGALIILTGLAFLPMLYSLIFPFLPRHHKTC